MLYDQPLQALHLLIGKSKRRQLKMSFRPNIYLSLQFMLGDDLTKFDENKG